MKAWGGYEYTHARRRESTFLWVMTFMQATNGCICAVAHAGGIRTMDHFGMDWWCNGNRHFFPLSSLFNVRTCWRFASDAYKHPQKEQPRRVVPTRRWRSSSGINCSRPGFGAPWEKKFAVQKYSSRDWFGLWRKKSNAIDFWNAHGAKSTAL